MLDKLKVTAIVAAIIQILKTLYPDVVDENFEGAFNGLINAILVAIPIFAGWATPESTANIAKLKTR